MADSYNELFGLGTYSVDASLVAWFKLQDDPASSALDSSGNSVSATVLGDPTSEASSGFLAKHFVFDGIDDGVDLGRPAALQLESGPLTILARAYNSTGGKSLITMGTSRSSASSRTFDLFDNGSQFRFQGLRPAGASWTAQTTTRPSLNAWHNYAATWDGTTDSNAAKLYVDNSLAAQATPISSSLTTGHNWYLGGYQPTSTQFEWNGNAKDFALFSRVLTAAEIGHWDSGPEPVNTVANSLNDDGTGSVGSWDSQANGTITYLTTLYDASDDSSVATSTAASFDFSGDITGGETYYAVTVASNDGGSASAENQTTADVTMAGGGSVPNEGGGNFASIGLLEGQGDKQSNGSGTIQAIGSLSPVGKSITQGNGSVVTIGLLSGEGFKPVVGAKSGSGLVNGIAELTGAGESNKSGAGSFLTVGTIEGVGFAPTVGEASGLGSIITVGDFTGQGVSNKLGSGSFNGIGVLSGVGFGPAISGQSGFGSVNGFGLLTGQGLTTRKGSGSFSAIESIFAIGQKQSQGFGSVRAVGLFTGAGPISGSFITQMYYQTST